MNKEKINDIKLKIKCSFEELIHSPKKLAILFFVVLTIGTFSGFLVSYIVQQMHYNKPVEMSLKDKERYQNEETLIDQINVVYLDTCQFAENGKESITFKVMNIPSNYENLVFEIYNDKKESIYKSKPIPPGYEINAIKLHKRLFPGVYEYAITISYETNPNIMSTLPLNIVVKAGRTI